MTIWYSENEKIPLMINLKLMRKNARDEKDESAISIFNNISEVFGPSILGKNFVVNVDRDIVVICSGKSQSYTIRLVGNRDQADWKKASVQLLRSNSLEEIVSTIKNRLSVKGFTKN